ncbi:MAG: FIST C-terminal domain-containing protein [Sulfurospirillum sp.]|nr:FIST C-terminal domain-containing protein [Sulfurospirillum sp.]MBP9493483.1 FIST C-terminal domain-containing protein [Sulfurospirillum sp.]MBP9612217.1 FIST C-terminal domain-containing protein [Sulfurospirillum sp.]
MFQSIHFVQTPQSLPKYLTQGTYLLLIGAKTLFTPESLPSNVTIYGAVFPRIVFGKSSYDEGILVAHLASDTTITLIETMSDLSTLHVNDETRSVLTILDGLSQHIEVFLEDLFSLIPERSKIMGGGAGKLTLTQEPILFDNHRFYKDSALILQHSKKIGLGVKHGWEAVVMPLMATQCSSHKLERINFQTAYPFYKAAVEADTHLRFDGSNFFDIAKNYPIGIMRYNKDFIVRDPIYTDGESLTLIGNIDPNSVIAILKGKDAKLIQAAHEAASIAASHAEKECDSVLLIDCISRYLFLEERFKEELEAISSAYAPNTILWGVLSLGEIANANEEGIEFYNKTCVVGTL